MTTENGHLVSFDSIDDLGEQQCLDETGYDSGCSTFKLEEDESKFGIRAYQQEMENVIIQRKAQKRAFWKMVRARQAKGKA